MIAGPSGSGVGSLAFVCALGDQLFVMRSAAVVGLIANHAFGQLVAESAGGHVFVAFGVMQQQRCAADFQSMIDFRRHIAIVERRRHQTGLQTSQIVNDQRRAIGHQRCDPIAGFQAQRQVLCRQPGADLIELPPTHLRLG